MRRTLGTLLLALLLPLAGCGDDGSDPAPDTVVDTTPVLVSATSGGGVVATRATELGDRAAVRAYVAQFDASFAAEVTRAAGDVDVPAGDTLVAAVVSISCDEAPGADVRRTDAGIEITAHEVSAPHEECFAPVTTVALAPVRWPDRP